ncbi:MAG: saccharopine dehydrogenase family protein [Parvibaculales bacterium]
MSDTEFDIIVYGASGFTGRLVAEYMQQQYGRSVNWAMAGRSTEKLAQVRDEMGIDAATPLIAANADYEAELAAMAARTKVMITTVGPYQLYGSALVAACVAAGTDYVDLSGEPGWMYEMIEAHDKAAKASGARIVHSCGFDSIPFDLGVYYLQQAAQEKFGTPCSQIRTRVHAMNGEFSGGTAASLGATMAAVSKNPDLLGILANPFSLANGHEGPAQPADNAPYEDEATGQWVAPFIMAAINTKNIHRSNALLDHAYGKDFLYDEMMLCGDGDKGKAMAEFVATSNPLAGDDVPQPGEGPSKESREAGNYDVLFIGTTDNGARMEAAVGGDMDPGYGSTSKMLAESAMCLLQDSDGLAGGVYTPAPAMGDKLIKRLIDNAGLYFRMEK